MDSFKREIFLQTVIYEAEFQIQMRVKISFYVVLKLFSLLYFISILFCLKQIKYILLWLRHIYAKEHIKIVTLLL